MANYVRNYVFCNNQLYDDFMHTDYDHRLFQDGTYDLEGYILEDDRRLIIFETHGMDYRVSLIEKIIRLFPDTIWYCIEENNIVQGAFWWFRNQVVMETRSLQEATHGCVLSIEYTDKYWRLLKSIVAFPDRIIVEDPLHNRFYMYELSAAAGQELLGHINTLIKEVAMKSPTCHELPLSPDCDVWRCYALWEPDDHDYGSIECSDSDGWNEDDINTGAAFEKRLIDFLQSFFEKNGIETELIYKKVEDFV